jgi:hypothetical protein
MSLKLYIALSSFTCILILVSFSVLFSLSICIMQTNFEFWLLYFLRIVTQIFETYNLFCICIFLIFFIIITFYLKKTRNLIFIILSSFLFGIIMNYYDLKILFIYKSQPVDQYFYLYIVSYVVCIIVWYNIFKKIWKKLI